MEDRNQQQSVPTGGKREDVPGGLKEQGINTREGFGGASDETIKKPGSDSITDTEKTGS